MASKTVPVAELTNEKSSSDVIDLEKPADAAMAVEGDVDVERAGLDGHAVAFDAHGHALVKTDAAAETRLRNKIDWHIVPVVWFAYICCFIDRSNIGNARLAGLEKDLGMTGNDYNAALSYFYITYILSEIPAQVVCKMLGPGKWIPICTTAFGIVTMCTAFVRDLNGLIAVRVILGLAEAGMLPGIAFYLSRWYRKDELVFRLALYIVASPLAGAFGGLLASGILSTGDIGTVKTWEKIYLVEGIITIGIGVLAYFLMTDRPETAPWLSPAEKALAATRIKSESPAITTANEKAAGKVFWAGINNINAWTMGLIFLLNNISVQGISVFLPTIINALYPTDSTVTKQLKTVPPYIVGAFVSLAMPLISWKINRRALIMLVCSPLMVIGFAMALAGTSANVKYAGTFLAISGAFPFGALTNGWIAANTSPESARATAIGVVVFSGNIGGLISTWTFTSQYAPRYVPGLSLNIATAAAIFFIVGALWLYQIRENRLREAGRRDKRLEGLSHDEVALLGHLHPQYRYAY